MLKVTCSYKQQVLPIWKNNDNYYCVFIKEDIHRSQHPVCNFSLDKILELYKKHIDSSKYITSEDCDLELEVNYKDEVRNYYNLPSADDTITKFISLVDNEEKGKDMKITFTFGDTVTINLTQNDDGYYVYTPSNYVTSAINFFSIKDAILFFSKFLPVEVYHENEYTLSFVVNIDYRNIGVAFYMSEEDRTKISWTNYNRKNKGYGIDFLKESKKENNSIDDVIRYFISYVDEKEERKKIAEHYKELEKARKKTIK